MKAHLYEDESETVVAFSLEEARSLLLKEYGARYESGEELTVIPDDKMLRCRLDMAVPAEIQAACAFPNNTVVSVVVRAGEWAESLRVAGKVPSIVMSEDF